ncbi:hypothetical protein BV20DRAFT_962502 [Pilatotrama ljubarskyi]|nr:hypothetical protein BV20DRAFT_962502 [Pilatotrama ljubarskyi]
MGGGRKLPGWGFLVMSPSLHQTSAGRASTANCVRQRPPPPLSPSFAFASLSQPGLSPSFPFPFLLLVLVPSRGRSSPAPPRLDNASLLPQSTHTPTPLPRRVAPPNSSWPMSSSFRNYAPPSPARTAPPVAPQPSLKRRRPRDPSTSREARDTSIADQPQICTLQLFSSSQSP